MTRAYIVGNEAARQNAESHQPLDNRRGWPLGNRRGCLVAAGACRAHTVVGPRDGGGNVLKASGPFSMGIPGGGDIFKGHQQVSIPSERCTCPRSLVSTSGRPAVPPFASPDEQSAAQEERFAPGSLNVNVTTSLSPLRN